MKLALLQTGKTTNRNIAEVAELYTGRIKKYMVLETITLPDIKNTRNMTAGEQKLKEGKKIIMSLSTEDYVILLDEKGRELRTVELSQMIEKIFALNKKRIVFVIGGPWGFSDEVYSRADYKLSLSKMTFPHELVRLLFLEQLYRVFTILRGEPYHHE